MAMQVLLNRFVRKKYIPADQVCSTNLDRCLSTLDLTALGIGSTLGLGIYVMAGDVAKNQAGPAVTLSFLIAAIASVFAGLCYAEFGARVPRAGSAYVYSYVTVGELIAFVIGWNLVLEYVIGTASVASGYSGYINYLTNYKINSTLTDVLPIHVLGLSPYPDFLAFGITLVLAGVLSIGVKESSLFNNICTLINLMVVAYVIICGSVKADIKNWKIPESEVPEGAGTGGFFPYGFSGLMAGAAKCFYGFVGFDCIATTGEEVKNPQRAIPISIVMSLLTIFLAYFGISVVITLMLPYYAQNESAPIPYAFEAVNWEFAKWFVSIGALTGLSTSLLGGMFPLPRILYAMAKDGLIFRFLAQIHPRYKTPMIATLIAGFFTAVMAMIFSVQELMEMMSIGTLMAYTLVAASVLVLRYSCAGQLVPRDCVYSPLLPENDSGGEYSAAIESDDDDELSVSVNGNMDIQPILHSTSTVSCRSLAAQIFNIHRIQETTELSFYVAKTDVILYGLFSMCLGACIAFLNSQLLNGVWWAIALTSVFGFSLIIVFISLALQPQNHDSLTFKVPMVPVIPALSIFINVFLMLKLSAMTWARFGVWLAIGLAIYFFYGMRESSEEYRSRGLPPPADDGNTNKVT